jgi:copper chaperone NosL
MINKNGKGQEVRGNRFTICNSLFAQVFSSILPLIFLIVIFSGCTKDDVEKLAPIEFTRAHACALCGMITVDFPGSKGQIHYSNGKIDAFCCTLDMFSFYLQPDSPKNITAIFVNDMGKADWERPSGHWIEAKKAYYVIGGNIMGPMGEALVPFFNIKDAEAYIKEQSGKIVKFDDINMEMLKPKARSHS